MWQGELSSLEWLDDLTQGAQHVQSIPSPKIRFLIRSCFRLIGCIGAEGNLSHDLDRQIQFHRLGREVNTMRGEADHCGMIEQMNRHNRQAPDVDVLQPFPRSHQDVFLAEASSGPASCTSKSACRLPGLSMLASSTEICPCRNSF